MWCGFLSRCIFRQYGRAGNISRDKTRRRGRGEMWRTVVVVGGGDMSEWWWVEEEQARWA